MISSESRMREIRTSGLMSGGEETWLRLRLRHRHRAKAAGNSYSLKPTAGRASPRLYSFPDTEVSFPGMNEQVEIANILASHDDLIENNRRRIALLEEAARLLYREWFVHFRFPGHERVKITDGIPEGWERRTFDDVCKAVGGGTPKTSKPEYWGDGNIPWYTPTDVTRNSCLALLDSATKITEAGLRGSSARMLPPDTILMTSRASVGFFGIIDAPSCTNQGFISILPHDSWARMYLLHNLMHRVEEVRSHAGGATYREINKGKFSALPVLLPEESLLRGNRSAPGGFYRLRVRFQSRRRGRSQMSFLGLS